MTELQAGVSPERPAPKAKRDCLSCARSRQLRLGAQSVVSARKLAHVAYDGRTACGRDARSDGWWRPL